MCEPEVKISFYQNLMKLWIYTFQTKRNSKFFRALGLPNFSVPFGLKRIDHPRTSWQTEVSVNTDRKHFCFKKRPIATVDKNSMFNKKKRIWWCKKHSFRLPWDVQTPLGYIAEILFSIGVCEVYLAFNGTILLFFVSICWYHRAFYHMFQQSLEEFNECAKDQYHKKLLCKLISFHNSIKGYYNFLKNCYLHFFHLRSF